MKTFKKLPSHPVLLLPETYPVYDFSKEEDRKRADENRFGIGRYNEKRELMYQTPIFEGKRNIHMGVDLFAPVGTPVHSFANGKIFLFGNNNNDGDYGYTLITEHRFGDTCLYALYGHLSRKSLDGKVPGQPIGVGDVIAWVGDRHENGNWTPHLHFQISPEKPEKPDMPGVVSAEDHAAALLKYPDPRIVLGPVYL